MSGSRVLFWLLVCLSGFCSCFPKKHTLNFAISHHNIKLQYDPGTHELTSVDTMSITYRQNVDQIYFFLHKTLRVERIGVAHQEFQSNEMKRGDIERVCRDLSEEWQHIVENCHIVAFTIPKSLYSERIQIHYRGKINLMQNSLVAWHPVVPNTQSTFNLTTLIPVDYQVIIKGDNQLEKVDDLWRLNQWNINHSQACCKLMVKHASG